MQAKALRRLAPQLRVDTFAQTIEALPLGHLRDCVILACVDSRIARQAINRRAFALGRPWIDAALDRDGQVRSRVYLPSEPNPREPGAPGAPVESGDIGARGAPGAPAPAGAGDCLECAWGERDYELLEQQVPCAHPGAQGSLPHAPATAAPQELGALAAALQVAHLRRVLASEPIQAPLDALATLAVAETAATAHTTGGGCQWFFDVRSGSGWVGRYTPNPACRLDHSPWSVTELARGAADLALSEALGLPGGNDSALAVEGQMFVQRLRCARCGVSRPVAQRIHSRLRPRACSRCGAVLAASASDATDVLNARNVPPQRIDATLSAFGLLDGDVFSIRSAGRTTRYLLCGRGFAPSSAAGSAAGSATDSAPIAVSPDEVC